MRDFPELFEDFVEKTTATGITIARITTTTAAPMRMLRRRRRFRCCSLP